MGRRKAKYDSCLGKKLRGQREGRLWLDLRWIQKEKMDIFISRNTETSV
jgi:hypothetical protein